MRYLFNIRIYMHVLDFLVVLELLVHVQKRQKQRRKQLN